MQISSAWFYFDRDGKLTPAGHPAEIPVAEFRPWTEVPAVMDAGFADGRPVLLVNKNGLLSPDQFAGPVSLCVCRRGNLYPFLPQYGV